MCSTSAAQWEAKAIQPKIKRNNTPDPIVVHLTVDPRLQAEATGGGAR